MSPGGSQPLTAHLVSHHKERVDWTPEMYILILNWGQLQVPTYWPLASPPIHSPYCSQRDYIKTKILPSYLLWNHNNLIETNHPQWHPTAFTFVVVVGTITEEDKTTFLTWPTGLCRSQPQSQLPCDSPLPTPDRQAVFLIVKFTTKSTYSGVPSFWNAPSLATLRSGSGNSDMHLVWHRSVRGLLLCGFTVPISTFNYIFIITSI